MFFTHINFKVVPAFLKFLDWDDHVGQIAFFTVGVMMAGFEYLSCVLLHFRLEGLESNAEG